MRPSAGHGAGAQSLALLLVVVVVLLAAPAHSEQPSSSSDDAPQQQRPSRTSTARPFAAEARHPGRSWLQEGWLPLHEAMVAEARALEGAPDGVEVVMYGDSITECARGTLRGSAGCEDYHVAWRHTIGDRFRNASVFAIAGDRTPHLLWRIQNGELGGLQPRVAVLLIGTNDLGFAYVCRTEPQTPDCAGDKDAGNLRVAAERTAATIERMVERLLQASDETRVLLQAVLPRGAGHNHSLPNIFTAPVALLNQRLQEIAASRPRVHYADCGADFIARDGKALVEAFMPDALHPNAAGAVLMYQCVACAIRQLLRHPAAAERHADLGALPCYVHRGWHTHHHHHHSLANA